MSWTEDTGNPDNSLMGCLTPLGVLLGLYLVLPFVARFVERGLGG